MNNLHKHQLELIEVILCFIKELHRFIREYSKNMFTYMKGCAHIRVGNTAYNCGYFADPCATISQIPWLFLT